MLRSTTKTSSIKRQSPQQAAKGTSDRASISVAAFLSAMFFVEGIEMSKWATVIHSLVQCVLTFRALFSKHSNLVAHTQIVQGQWKTYDLKSYKPEQRPKTTHSRSRSIALCSVRETLTEQKIRRGCCGCSHRLYIHISKSGGPACSTGHRSDHESNSNKRRFTPSLAIPLSIV